ncbi:MAG: DUF5329 domain-containing protein [Proteobacteria bacterium]|nr:DUF5329 domain-containing protein [Pseudomonadota bacterium]
MGNLSHAADNEEINYLLSYLSDSGCTFIRNGDEHQAQEAREHLEMKYNHAKGRIKTAEDFIDKIASKSSLSRRQYEVRCADVQLSSKQWLDEALAFHRASIEKQKQKD